MNGYLNSNITYMGQNQSYEAIDKTAMEPHTEEIVVSSNKCENEPFDHLVEHNNSSNHSVSHNSMLSRTS